MKYTSRSIKGHGRGAGLGFPTINMRIPEDLPLSVKDGIYAAWVTIRKVKFPAALYYGKSATFNGTEHSLEVYLIDEKSLYIQPDEPIEFEVVSFIRGDEKFDTVEQLVLHMGYDIEKIREILKLK